MKRLNKQQWNLVCMLIEASHLKPKVQRAADILRDEFQVGKCRCGTRIDEPNVKCEWHQARLERAS